MVRFGLWLVSSHWQAGITHPESRLSQARATSLAIVQGTALRSGFDPDFHYSVICSPDPPNSAGKSLNFGRPSFMGRTVSA